MKVLIKKVTGIEIPKQANETDTGFDVIAVSPAKIVGEKIDIFVDGLTLYSRIDYLEYETNLALACEKDLDYIQIFPRSSISTRNLMLKNSVAVIDNGFRNNIVLRFAYIIQPENIHVLQEYGRNRCYVQIDQDKIYQQFQKIAQIVAAKRIKIDFEFVDKLPDSQRGLNGLGSSGQ